MKIKRLLVITQKVDRDDSVLGFFHEWLKEISFKVDNLTVICLQKGNYDLPNNVNVISLGKEKSLRRLKYLINFYKTIFNQRNNYDSVFVHMNVEYIILAGLFWKLMKKNVFLWYTHKTVSLRLRFAHMWVKNVFTASKESFRLHSKKMVVMGHGINTDKFSPDSGGRISNTNSDSKNNSGLFNILSVGRISEIKDYKTLVLAIKDLKEIGKKIKLEIVGSPITDSDFAYFQKIKDLIAKLQLNEQVNFAGPVTHDIIPKYINSADLFVNMSNTDSIDKAVLEAMSCGKMVLTSNYAFKEMLGGYDLVFKKGDVLDLTIKIKKIMDKEDISKVGLELRSIVVNKNSLPSLIDSLVNKIYETSR
jgi:glycosyltransferase involved in cell wall biosynthesis